MNIDRIIANQYTNTRILGKLVKDIETLKSSETKVIERSLPIPSPSVSLEDFQSLKTEMQNSVRSLQTELESFKELTQSLQTELESMKKKNRSRSRSNSNSKRRPPPVVFENSTIY
jgi:FtsZ-binding cell division protein ZapB